MAFTGFPREGVSWFQALALNQRREWFEENKAAYTVLWLEPMQALLPTLQAPLQKLYGRALAPPKIFRLHRDLRFSKDKTPYKTNVSAVFRFEGAESAALYFQLGLEDFVAAGFYALEPPALKRYRAAVLNERSGAILRSLLDTAATKGLTATSVERLKRAPAGIDPDHPRVDLLRAKGLAVSTESIPKKVRFSASLADWLLEQAKNAVPVVKWGFDQKLA